MRAKLALSAVVVMLMAILTGCGASQTPSQPTGSGDKDKVLLGYSAPELYGGQVTIQNGFVESARALGYGVVTTNANGDVKKQADQIDYLLSLGVKAIVSVPVDSAAICPSIKKAEQAGVPFFTIDRAPTGCKATMVVLADNYMAGKQAGEAMVEALKAKYGEPKGTVLELQGDLGTNVAQLRGNGFNDVIKQYPNIKVIQKPTNWQADKFSSITRDVLSTQEVDAIYLHSDNIGMPAILPVLEQMGKLKKRGEEGHIILIGVDGGPVILDAIRQGYADAAASQPLPDFGLLASQYIHDLLNGKEITEGEVVKEGASWSPARVKQGEAGWELFLATTLVTEKNVDDPALWGNQQAE